MQRNSDYLQIAQIVEATEAEGPGRRFAIWLQGCPLRCPGCCNPEMLSFEGGERMTVNQLVERVKSAAESKHVEGITLLGGEPFAHANGAALLAQRVRSSGRTVMIFSGYTLEELEATPDAAVAELLSHTDILVDGPYVADLPDTQRRWIGSTNQRVHFLTDRYSANDSRWQQTDTLEIRMIDGVVSVNGFPARGAVGMWKRPKKRPATDTLSKQ
ncbi:MAG: radical SAM protein [Pirellulales bacterium]|nr:radical SAM protein [Pirellulales bacterium]